MIVSSRAGVSKEMASFRAQEEVSKTGRRALTLPTDLSKVAGAAWTVEQTVDALGRIDVLVNAAGTDVPGTVEELDVEGWDRTLSVNLRAPFLISKAAFPHMRAAGGGTIVNVSSVAGKKGWRTPQPTVPLSLASQGSPRHWLTKGRSTA
jgi:NAD(P)-dependent dehydrogenase (short-subunit alcohol dehydrogenase family)